MQQLPLKLAICELLSLIAKNNFDTIPALSTKYPINKNSGHGGEHVIIHNGISIFYK